MPFPKQENNVKIDKWFNLQLEELRPVNKAIQSRTAEDLFACIQIDIFLNHGESGGDGPRTRLMLERWNIHYERVSSRELASHRTKFDYANMYKRLIILVRSVFSFVRLLPAFKLFRAACGSGHGSARRGSMRDEFGGPQAAPAPAAAFTLDFVVSSENDGGMAASSTSKAAHTLFDGPPNNYCFTSTPTDL